MKGFVYLIEVAVAGLVIAMTLATFLATTTNRTNWERPELIALGDSILWSVANSGYLNTVLSGDVSSITQIMPANVRWALHVSNTPKSNIKVGCYCSVTDFARVASMLQPVYLNGRLISFNVNQIDWPTADATDYDVIVFTRSIAFDNDASIQNYLSAQKGVVALFNIDAATLDGMNQTFDLSSSSKSYSPLPFTSYTPINNTIAKYFFGLGISTPDGLVKPSATDFAFSNFITDDGIGVKGANSIVGDSQSSAVAVNGTAVWISDFGASNEHSALVRAAVASLTTEWWAAEPINPRDTVSVINFASLCCDTPETVELGLWMWYVF